MCETVIRTEGALVNYLHLFLQIPAKYFALCFFISLTTALPSWRGVEDVPAVVVGWGLILLSFVRHSPPSLARMVSTKNLQN